MLRVERGAFDEIHRLAALHRHSGGSEPMLPPEFSMFRASCFGPPSGAGWTFQFVQFFVGFLGHVVWPGWGCSGDMKR
jgi:hypothetical protein